MIRAVIDTNVFVSAFLSSKSSPAQLLRLLEQEQFEVVTSLELLAELERALRYDKVRRLHKLTDEQIGQSVSDLQSIAIVVQPVPIPAVVLTDPDDNKLFSCALAGNAHYIVSGDAGVQAVGEYQGIRVLSPVLFVSLLSDPS
jgi:hypothetical protein